MLAPAVLDFTVNGRVGTRVGNTDPKMAPHGVYPAAGEDRWVAIVVPDDNVWRRFAAAIGRPDLAGEARFATAEGRLEHRAELDAVVAQWTTGLPSDAIEAHLQALAIPCSVVRDSRELGTDPQLEHRGHFVPLEPTDFPASIEASRARLSRTPAAPARAVPTLGRDNEEVLRTLLGYPESRVRDLLESGALR